MVTPNDLRAVVAAGGSNPSLGPSARRRVLADALAALPAGTDEIVAAAVAGLADDDRNVRVAMLRVLALFATPAATAGVLRGLTDPVRRVRDVAIRAAQPHHLAAASIVEVLQRLVDDDAEIDRLRRTAFEVLASASTHDPIPEVTRAAITTLVHSSRFRGPLVRRLCSSLAHTLDSRHLLREIVRTGTKDEAVMATRALCGQVLLRTDIVPEDERRRVRDEFDREDDLHRWVPAPVALELVQRWGGPR